MHRESMKFVDGLIRFGVMRLQMTRRNEIHFWSRFKRWQELEKDYKEHMKEEALISARSPPGSDMYISPERREDVLPKKAIEDQTRRDSGRIPVESMAFLTQMRYVDHSFDNIRRFKRYERFQIDQYDQRFIPERQIFLGPDLAAAHFLVHRGASVKFVGDDVWIRRNRYGQYNLPGRRIDDLYIEAVDASDTKLIYVNDWMVGRIGSMFSKSLEFLDLSNCGRISSKGLIGLRSLKKLRYLRLEGVDHVKDLAKAALQLEECITGLKVIGINYDGALKSLRNEIELLESDRVFIDAKGNAHVEDNDGRFFYVAGRVNERPVVCDEDKSIIASTIRREIPEMSNLEFDRLDKMSGGKLRHLLLGSPSGYSWSGQVETILSHELWWNKKIGVPTNPKMLPSSAKSKLSESIDETKRLDFKKELAETLL